MVTSRAPAPTSEGSGRPGAQIVEVLSPAGRYLSPSRTTLRWESVPALDRPAQQSSV